VRITKAFASAVAWRKPSFLYSKEGVAVAKGIGKRAYHKQDMNKQKRTALTIGGVMAAVILLVIIVSFVT